MPRWTNGRLDLGALGIVEVLDEISPPSRCWWEWGEVQSEGYYQTESAARRAAEQTAAIRWEDLPVTDTPWPNPSAKA